MTTYRLFPSTSGPAGPLPYVGNFEAGVIFQVTQGGMWVEGFYWWVPTGGDTGAQKFCLWSVTGTTGAGTVVPGTTVTSGTLTAGAWNYITLSYPVPIAVGGTYVAATAWASANGFPITQAQFGSGDPFSAGIVNGPLSAFGDGTSGGTNTATYSYAQGLFSTASTDPTVSMPDAGSNSSNFWIDILVSDTAPSGYPGPYRLWPNTWNMNAFAAVDSPVNYDIAQVFTLAEACTINAVWYYSPPGTAQLATECGVWSVTGGGLTGSLLIDDTSPSWSGAPGSGWVREPLAGPPVLPAGTYKAFVYNGAATPDGWSAKDASTNYWATGAGANGIVNGPLSAPNLAGAPLANKYSTSGTEPGQNVFSVGPPNSVPNEYVDGLAQWYGVDVEVTPVPATVVTQTVYSMRTFP